MQRKTIKRWVGIPILTILVLLTALYIGFVPAAKEPSYVFITSWGSRGNEIGQFDDPTGIAVSDEEVFVADSRNGRIQVFDLNGRFLRTFGRPGESIGELGRPMNLTIQEGMLYVAEYFNDRVQVFKLDGTPIRIIGSAGNGKGEFNSPGGIGVAENGDLFVADFYNQRVQQLREDGSFIKQWGKTGEVGSSAGQFNYPTDVAVASDGTIFVADGYNDRIQAFSATGIFLDKWGGPFAMNIFGPFRGWFATVTDITIGPAQNLFVADFYNHRIQKFSHDGTFLSAFGRFGGGPGQFRYPIGVAGNGDVFVTDFQNNRVQKWRPQ